MRGDACGLGARAASENLVAVAARATRHADPGTRADAAAQLELEINALSDAFLAALLRDFEGRATFACESHLQARLHAEIHRRFAAPIAEIAPWDQVAAARKALDRVERSLEIAVGLAAGKPPGHPDARGAAEYARDVLHQLPLIAAHFHGAIERLESVERSARELRAQTERPA